MSDFPFKRNDFWAARIERSEQGSRDRHQPPDKATSVCTIPCSFVTPLVGRGWKVLHYLANRSPLTIATHLSSGDLSVSAAREADPQFLKHATQLREGLLRRPSHRQAASPGLCRSSNFNE